MQQDLQFCNTDVTLEAWYAVGRCRLIKPGQARSFAIGRGLRVLVRRFRDGQLVATQPNCPHMGADLRLAREHCPGHFQCAFHGLSFDSNGDCVSAIPAADQYHLTTFPVAERYGLIWVYLGAEPRYELPELGLDGGFFFHTPSQSINCHHHMVVANPLDHVHTATVHGFETHERDYGRDGIQVWERVSGVYRRWWMMLLSNTFHRDLDITYWSHGPTVSVADARWHGRRFVVLFTGRQNEREQCQTNTVIWMDSGNPVHWFRVLVVLMTILKQDVDILNTLDVRTRFMPGEDGMIGFRDMVNSMPTFAT